MRKIVVMICLIFLGLNGMGNYAAANGTDLQPDLVDQVNGTIVDVKDNRILFLDSSQSLKIKDRGTGNIVTVVEGKHPMADFSFLSPKGAIFLEQSGDQSTRALYDWRDGQLVSIGKVSRSLIVKGNYAVFSDPGSTIYLRDLVNGTNKPITSDAYYGYDIGENGMAVWSGKDFMIYKQLNGQTVKVTSGNWDYRYTFPLTDGVNVIYKANSERNSWYGIESNGADPRYTAPPMDLYRPYSDYQVNNGFTAQEYYDDYKHTSQVAVDKDGNDPRTLECYPDLIALGPQGDVVYANNQYHRYVINRNFTLPFHPSEAFWLGGETLLTDGGALYSLSFTDTDTLPPVTETNFLPGNTKNPVNVTFNARDEFSGVEATYYRVNEGEIRSGTSVTLSDEGVYHLEYWSVDKAGNAEAHKSKSFTIDKTAPVTKYTVAPIYGTDKPVKYIKGYSMTLTATDALSGVSGTFYRFSTNEPWVRYEGPVTLSGSGDRNIYFFSVDKAGNFEGR